MLRRAWVLGGAWLLACASAGPNPEPEPEPEPVAAGSLSGPAPASRPSVIVEPPPSVTDPTAPPGFASAPLRVEVLPEGLERHDYALGSGPEAGPGSRLRLHYSLVLPDGTEVDSTYARATPFEYELGRGQLIPGMERGLEGVRAGMHRKLIVPPALGYGERSVGSIPANATLIFYLEILEVQAPLPPARLHGRLGG